MTTTIGQCKLHCAGLMVTLFRVGAAGAGGVQTPVVKYAGRYKKAGTATAPAKQKTIIVKEWPIF
jgi:hypothetical protein